MGFNPQVTVLIVDDDMDMREILAFALAREGYHVLQAECGNDAYDVICNQHVDVVVTDVRMPRGDGIELLERIKARNPLLPPVIILTGFADLVPEDVYEKGAFCLMSKPFDQEDLFSAVHWAVTPNVLKAGSVKSKLNSYRPLGS